MSEYTLTPPQSITNPAPAPRAELPPNGAACSPTFAIEDDKVVMAIDDTSRLVLEPRAATVIAGFLIRHAVKAAPSSFATDERQVLARILADMRAVDAPAPRVE